MKSKFRVLLIYSNLQMITLLPNNIAVLCAYLKMKGIDVKVFNTTFYRLTEKSIEEKRVEYMQIRPFSLKDNGIDYENNDMYNDFIKMVEEYKPNLIGVSTTEDTYDIGISLVSKVREKGIHIIFGGIYPTFSPDKVIGNPSVDSVCVGEGEEALFELCMKMQSGEEITKIKNLVVKVRGKIYKNDLRAPLDINSLPFDDFSVFEEKMFFRPMQGKIRRMIPFTLSRGCPFICSFCAAPLLRSLYASFEQDKYFRVKTTKRIISELKYYSERYKADYIYFNSETFFTKNDKEMNEFAQAYSNEINLPFWCQTRIETITETRIKILKDIKCDRVNVGMEHGNEEFRKKVLRKHFTNKQAIEAFRILEKSGVAFTVNNMIGFPDETRELAFDTIRFNRSIKADAINAFIFVPYSGTPLRQYCIDNGYLDPNAKSDTDIGRSILNMPQFTAEQIKGLARTFPLYVKMPESYFDKIRIAEQLTEEGDTVFSQLREMYLKEYFD